MSTALHTLSVFQQHIDAGVAPGGQLCVCLGGKVLLDAAYGVLAPGHAAVTTDTIYDLASLTKPLATAYLCAKLDLQGVDNLLEHCAGYPAHRHFYKEATGRDAIVALARSEPLEYAPRTKALYSDLGFIVLGDEIEKRTGKRLDELIRRDEMGVFYVGEQRPGDVFAPTSGTIDDENCRAMGGVAGHAGLFGTAHAVMSLGERWLAAWQGTDESEMSQRIIKRYWERSTVPGSMRTLGWDMPAETGSSTGDVWPLDSVGHLGFTGTSLWIEPRMGLVVSLCTNRVFWRRDDRSGMNAMRRAVHAALWQELTN